MKNSRIPSKGRSSDPVTLGVSGCQRTARPQPCRPPLHTGRGLHSPGLLRPSCCALPTGISDSPNESTPHRYFQQHVRPKCWVLCHKGSWATAPQDCCGSTARPRSSIEPSATAAVPLAFVTWERSPCRERPAAARVKALEGSRGSHTSSSTCTHIHFMSMNTWNILPVLGCSTLHLLCMYYFSISYLHNLMHVYICLCLSMYICKHAHII